MYSTDTLGGKLKICLWAFAFSHCNSAPKELFAAHGEYFKIVGGRQLRRASDLYGLPVVDSTTQRKMGAVNEVLIDLPRECLVALVMPGMLLGEPGLIPVEGAFIGSEQVMLADREVVTRGDVASRLRQGKITLDRARKLTVVTRSGERLGNVDDLILDGCRIVSLELSDGLIQDIFQGRTVLKLPEDVEFEGEHIIVPDDTHCQPSGHKQQSTWHRDQGF